MGESNTKGIIIMFLAVIIGLAFLQGIFSITGPQSQLQSAINESHSVAAARVGANNINESYMFNVTNDQASTGNTPISAFVLKNNTYGSAVLDTDYNVNLTTGQFNLLNTTFWVNNPSNQSYADYNYKASSYIENSFTRTLLSVLLGLIALTLIMVILAKVVKMFGGVSE